MAGISKEDKKRLIDYHATSDINTSAVEGMRKWERTFEDQTPGSEDKILALKKTLLLYGSANLAVTGTAVVNGRTQEKVTRLAADNNETITEYVAAHMGRAYMSLPKGKGGEVLDWISGKSEESAGVVYPRFAATHAGRVDEQGKVHEQKLNPLKSAALGVKSIFASMFSKAPRVHHGMDVAMGGEGNPYNHIDATVKGDGSSGHVYFNLNTGRNGDSLGVGMEGTAPGVAGPLGAHSLVGAADDFTPLEGPKTALNFSPKSSTCLAEISSQVGALKGNAGADQEAVDKIEKHCAGITNHAKKPWYKRMFSKPEDSLSKSELKAACENVGIAIIDGGRKMLTGYGKQLAESGSVVQQNYNGLRANLSNQAELAAVMAVDVASLSTDMMIYGKPQASVSAFVAQEPIYAGIKEKPVLRSNPQLGHETCVAIGTMYNVAQDAATPPEQKAAIEQTLALFTKENLKTLGMDINKFNARADIPKLLETLQGNPDLAAQMGVNEAVVENLNGMKHLADRASDRAQFTTKDSYVALQAEFLNPSLAQGAAAGNSLEVEQSRSRSSSVDSYASTDIEDEDNVDLDAPSAGFPPAVKNVAREAIGALRSNQEVSKVGKAVFEPQSSRSTAPASRPVEVGGR